MAAKKIILWVVLLIVAANFALVGVVVMGTMKTIPPMAPMPNPNGRDDFVKAGKMLTTTEDSYRELTSAQFRTLIVSNAPSLSLVRLGLTKDCLTPVEDLKWKSEEHTAQLNSFKLLTLAFSAEATVAELQKRYSDAADIWIDAIRFSHAFARGGSYADVIKGWESEDYAMPRLVKLLPDADAHTCAFVAKDLAEIDAKSQSLDEIKNADAIYNGKPNFRQSASHLIHYKRLKIYHENFAKSFNVQTRQLRQTMLNFAARAYELEKGKKPASAADLVPTYLKAVPQDPITGTSLEIK